VHGAYYYQVSPALKEMWDGKSLFRLGATLAEAYKAWGERIGCEKVSTVGGLLDRYARDAIPLKAPKTQADNLKQLRTIRATFGGMLLKDIRPQHIYQYMDKRTAKVAAKRELALLSHAYTKAVEWGYLDRHPFKGEVRLKSEKPRTRYVTDEEVIACLALPPLRGGADATLMVQAYIRLKLLTGLRRGDLLRLKTSDVKEDGIHVTTQKTGKALVYEWSDELRAAIELIPRKVDISPWVFSTRRGLGYQKEVGSSGWNSIWQRFMARAVKAGVERFTEHDLRAKAASDAGSLEHARALLAHADSRITEKVYRRKPERVKPLR
jgi:integrase